MVVHLFWIWMMGYYIYIYIYVCVCGFYLIMCVMMLPKFCEFLVHIVIEMLVQYNGK